MKARRGDRPGMDAGIFARESSVLGRSIQIGVAGGKVISLSFPTEPDPGAATDHEVLDRIVAYLDGELEAFEDVDIGLTVPTAHRAILERTRSIPYGQEITVERLTRAVPDLDAEAERDRTQVRTALSANPIPLIIPDHRVSDGDSAAPSSVVATLREIEGL